MSGRFGSGAYSKLMNRMAVKYTPMEYAKGTFVLLSYIFLIAVGSILINNQLRLSACHPNDGVILNNSIGSLLIISGSLLTLYFFFQLIRPTPVASI